MVKLEENVKKTQVISVISRLLRSLARTLRGAERGARGVHEISMARGSVDVCRTDSHVVESSIQFMICTRHVIYII